MRNKIFIVKKIIDNKVSRGLDENLPDAHIFGWDPDPPITEYELIDLKLDDNNYRCECYYVDVDNVKRKKIILISLEEYSLWLSENRNFLINSIIN